MKKRTLFILALLPFIAPLNTDAVCSEPVEEGTPIVIEYKRPPQPRSIEPHCYFWDGSLYIMCNSYITSVSGTITRLSDNMQWSDSSTSNVLQIAVSSDAGSYHLTFTLSDGTSYYGDYILE